MINLLDCPFCGSDAEWCSDADKDDIHDCHLIICTGCKAQFDMVTDEVADTVEELKVIAAEKFYERVY